MAIFGRKKVYLLIPTPGKVGTWWDLNPHCSGGHIVRAIAKHRVTDTGKVLKYTLKNTENVLDLNPRPSDNLIVPLCFAL